MAPSVVIETYRAACEALEPMARDLMEAGFGDSPLCREYLDYLRGYRLAVEESERAQ